MATSIDMAGVSSIGDVEFIERIGVGIGSGRFRARLGGGGPVVSLLLAEAEKFDKQGLMDWARRMKRVDHPGVPGVIQIEDALEPGFVAQRYVDGETLEQRVERLGGPLAAVDGLPLLLQAAAALRAAHRNGLAHGALAPRSLVLEVRDGAMDAVRLVGWRPLAPGLTQERAVARDLRALGELLYLALAGVPAPSRQAGEPPEPGAAVPVEFGDLPEAWGRSGRSGAGRGIFGALAAARRMTTVDAFVDALLPEFSRLTGDALAEVAYELSADREFKAEVERQRDRQRELDSKLRFIRDWLRDNAPAIEVVDDRVAGLEAQERSLRNLQVELAMLLDRPVRPGESLASTARPEVRAPEPMAAPPAVDEDDEDEADDAAPPTTVEAPPPPAAPASGMGRMLAVALAAAAVAGVRGLAGGCARRRPRGRSAPVRVAALRGRRVDGLRRAPPPRPPPRRR
ncbi:MAG: hypothetical protein H6706_15925 [Myxococcales bacterium]|nr:hypothetical protein [Myxococcales bacterium]